MSSITNNIKKKEILLWKGVPFYKLRFGISKKGGRNNLGRLCSLHKGGGCKRRYRIIDFNRNLVNVVGMVKRIEYDPNRTGYIALICYKNGFISYIIAVSNLTVGDRIVNYLNLNTQVIIKNLIKISNGSSLLLKDIPAGTLINNIELKPGFGSCFCRAAGTFALVLNKFFIFNKNYILIRLPSGVEYLLISTCRATIGIVSNINNNFFNLKKAGINRNLGKKSIVRGVAMNPIDHPHGGGEGRKSPKACAMSRWGKLSKGISTRTNRKSNKYILKKKND